MAFTKTRLDEEAISRLVILYKDTSRRLLSRFDQQTAFTQARRAELLAYTTRELTKLGVDTKKWLNTEVARMYKSGMEDAVGGLDILIRDGVIGADALSTRASFSLPNKRAVTSLVDDASESFAQSLGTVGKTVRNITGQAYQREVRATLAEGILSGQTRKEISAAIRDQLRSNGLTALVDKGGKRWSLESYADMLARTKLTEARNTGMINKMLENDQDLVQVSINGSDHEECAEWEGQILSISGKSDYPSFDEAESAGLFHPNCKHTVNPIEPKLAQETYGWDSETGEYERGILSKN